MKDELTKLRAEIEELEKNLSTVTSANATFAELSAMRIYLENIQKYIISLTNAFDQHQISCQEYSTQIQSLQEQIKQINTKLEEGTAINLDEINLKIDTLTLNLDDALAEIDTLKGGSDNTIAQLTRDVSDLQSEIGYINEEIEEITTEISTINTHIGDLQSQVNNLSSTQNSLTTAQSSLSSRVSSIDNRLTTAEANINTLTGGVDVAYLDQRITQLEDTNGPTCAHETYSFHNATPTNYTLRSREYSYSCSSDYMLYQKMKLSYETATEGTLTITIIEDQTETGESFIIDLKKHPYSFEISRQFYPKRTSGTIQIKAISDVSITYQTLDIWLFGKNTKIYNTDSEVKITSFDNKIYVSRYCEDKFYYGLFTDPSEIDINNLPNSRSYHDKIGCSSYMRYLPYIVNGYPYETFDTVGTEHIYRQLLNEDKYTVHKISQSETSTTTIINGYTPMYGGEINPVWASLPTMLIIKEGKPHLATPFYNGETHQKFINLDNFISGNWLYISPICIEYLTMESTPKTMGSIGAISLNEDGFFYFINQRNPVTQVIKLCKGGKSATAYEMEDRAIHIYISYNKFIRKIVLTYNESTNKHELASDEIIDNCTYIIQIKNTHILKKTDSGWVLEEMSQNLDISNQEA